MYEATHTSGNRAAFKILHRAHQHDVDLCVRFAEEYRLSQLLTHPDRVEVLGLATTDDGAPILVMELLEGETLAARWRRLRTLPPRTAVTIAIPLLEQLAACHALGIVHRDLKPENVFLDVDGRVRLLDFGTARGDRSITQRRVAIGTPEFMPPEQAQGRRERVDARSDVFAVGALLWAVLSGLHLRPARSDGEALRQAAFDPVRPLSMVAPDVPAALAAVVDRALRAEPDERWPTAAAMRDALRAILGTLPDEPLDDSPTWNGDRPTLPSTPSSLQSLDSETPEVRAPDATQSSATIASTSPRSTAQVASSASTRT